MGLASGLGATYNLTMRDRDRWVAMGLSVGVALAMLVPVLVATHMAPAGTKFAGFLLNPIDGFSYLAKMRQGLGGGWSFHLPYASEPGSSAFLFPYYLLLGHVARILGVPVLVVLHGARTVAAAVMFLAAYRFLEEFVADRAVRWFAFAMCLVGAGWGWLGIPFKFVASDLSIPETTPFLSAYANAHFPLATACVLLAGVGVLGEQAGRRRWIVASTAIGAVLALVLPFVLLPAVAVLLMGILVIARQERRASAPSSVPRRLVSLVAFLAGAAPWAIYGVWMLWTRPDLAAWNAQNQTPSPAPGAYLLGFAPLLLLAAIGVVVNREHRRVVGSLLAWVLIQAALLYAPLALQRRLSLGLFVPLAALAALGLAAVKRNAWRRPLTILALASAIPSNLIVVAAGLGGVARAEPLMVQSDDESCALAWLAENAEPGSLVLAGETVGNRIPAFADVRVVYGHPYETPHASEELAQVKRLFAASTDLASALPVLESRGVGFVYFGPEERALGPASWPADLPAACTCGEVIIAEVPAP